MIELIIWIFQQIFGSQEPPARVGPRSGRGGGGFGQDAGGQRPKTLAELLEEARAELDGGGTRPKPTPAPTPPPVAEAPRPTAPPATPVARQAAPLPRQAVSQPRIRVVRPPAPAVASVAATKSVPQRSRKQKKPGGAPLQVQADAKTAQPVGATPSTSTAKRGLNAWVTALQSSKPSMKQQAALIAVVSGVIIGPPKCRQRGHR